MRYLTDHRQAIRSNPDHLLPGVRTILCVGKVYNSPYPYSSDFNDDKRGWISRYAWGADYHDVLRSGLERVQARIQQLAEPPIGTRICVDTAPVLERSLARMAGLGWIAKNTCLINQQIGSWFFLGELLMTLELESDNPLPDRCGTCTRCIDHCPTAALIPQSDGRTFLDARLCISYLTIEKRGEIDIGQHQAMGQHLFGCDICQDVCPWNRKPWITEDPAFQPAGHVSPDLIELANLTAEEFRSMFRSTPVWRAKYSNFLRNVAIAMGNAGRQDYAPILERLVAWEDTAVSTAAQRALESIALKANTPSHP